MGRIKDHALSAEEKRRRPATLGEVASAGHSVFCWCNRCGHHAEMDAETLILRLGPEIAVPEIGPRMRCSGCGSKDVATRPHWPSPGQVAGHE